MQNQEKINGVLYVVSTPIGNYSDLSLRAKEVLTAVDYIAAEDTKRTAILLSTLGIKVGNRLISNHKFNEGLKTRYFINDLLSGKEVAIVTDAGTPCISDPGNELIREAIRNNIDVKPIPGCCAAIAALSVSGFPLNHFAFFGFMPRDNAGKKRMIEEIMDSPNLNTWVFYESPKRIIDTLRFLCDLSINCELCVCNDLTKIHEKVYRGTPEKVYKELLDKGSYDKGEYVLVAFFDKKRNSTIKLEELSPEAAIIDIMIKNNCSIKEAIKLIVNNEQSRYSRNELYSCSINLKELLLT